MLLISGIGLPEDMDLKARKLLADQIKEAIEVTVKGKMGLVNKDQIYCHFSTEPLISSNPCEGIVFISLRGFSTTDWTNFQRERLVVLRRPIAIVVKNLVTQKLKGVKVQCSIFRESEVV